MRIQFILVEPKVPENIGASARAIKTMGFEELILINPCEWREGKSKWVAHGSSDILDNALTYESLYDALLTTDFSVATSAKKRSVRQDYVAAEDLKLFLEKKRESAFTVSIVFGREESGLTNEEMRMCDITSSVSLCNPYPSLNLSQAVMIFAYELSGLKKISSASAEIKETDSYNALKRRMKDLLEETGIGQDDNRYGRILERIALLGDDDIHLLHSVTSHILQTLSIEKKGQR